MSKIFYDHLIEFSYLEVHINSVTESNEEKSELWEIVDKLVHNRIIKKILTVLPKHHHEEFADLVHRQPYNHQIISYLEERSTTVEDIEKYISSELTILEKEILQELQQDE